MLLIFKILQKITFIKGNHTLFKPDSMEAVSFLYLKPFLCELGLKCDFQNWVFLSMSNNLSCKNTLPTPKITFLLYKTPDLQLPPFWKFQTHPTVVIMEIVTVIVKVTVLCQAKSRDSRLKSLGSEEQFSFLRIFPQETDL